MTELIPGKRYRFTVEGEAIDTDSIHTQGGWCIMTNREGTVELLPDPLPTTPGSVVRVEAQVFLRRDVTFAPCWVGEDGRGYRDSDLTGATVLFDAGVKR